MPENDSISLYCSQCRSKLNSGATRCHSCGAFQTTRRWLNFINEIVSPIGTTVGLISVAVALLLSFVAPKKPVLHGKYLDRGEGLTFVFFNNGGASAILLNSSIMFPRKEGRKWYGGGQTIEHIPDKVVAPGEAVEIRYFDPETATKEFKDTLPGLVEETLSGFTGEEICTFKFVFADANDYEEDISIEFPCIDFAVEVR